MIDDFIDLTALSAADIAIDKAAKRRLWWARVIRVTSGFIFLAGIAGLIYLTVKYS